MHLPDTHFWLDMQGWVVALAAGQPTGLPPLKFTSAWRAGQGGGKWEGWEWASMWEEAGTSLH